MTEQDDFFEWERELAKDQEYTPLGEEQSTPERRFSSFSIGILISSLAVVLGVTAYLTAHPETGEPSLSVDQRNQALSDPAVLRSLGVCASDLRQELNKISIQARPDTDRTYYQEAIALAEAEKIRCTPTSMGYPLMDARDVTVTFTVYRDDLVSTGN